MEEKVPHNNNEIIGNTVKTEKVDLGLHDSHRFEHPYNGLHNTALTKWSAVTGDFCYGTAIFLFAAGLHNKFIVGSILLYHCQVLKSPKEFLLVTILKIRQGKTLYTGNPLYKGKL